jgi:hypothetical protein
MAGKVQVTGTRGVVEYKARRRCPADRGGRVRGAKQRCNLRDFGATGWKRARSGLRIRERYEHRLLRWTPSDATSAYRM